MSEGSEAEPKESPSLTCYRCGAALPQGAETCPNCGRKQFRACFCGARIRPDLAHCPYCGADWSHSRRVRRRSKSTRIKPKRLAQSAAIGAIVAFVGAVLMNVAVNVLAERSTPGGHVSPQFSMRLSYAWQTLARGLRHGWEKVQTMGTSIVLVLLVAGLGAGIGALWYLTKVGFVRWCQPSRSGRRTKHRRTRVSD